ncbi:hypothetical protein LSG23_20265 (plasmid) [Bacillus velezensis]|uniref:hypothetical protein n=1 Tax=Bacillus velezensis TaxID=492670 RepID=UPI0009880261|nr:hypothetical protein [Bacillus velezensis]AQS42457.1 hypothetical protein BVH55_00225 [Bacillus velezensis]WNR83259.1 hypothetical protein RP314_20585 [Bacillus velezensis]
MKVVVSMWLIHDTLCKSKISAEKLDDGKDSPTPVYIPVDIKELNQLKEYEEAENHFVFDDIEEALNDVLGVQGL